MDIHLIYEKLLLKLDATGSQNIAVDKSRAAIALNEAQNRMVEFFLSTKIDDNLRYIQKLLRTEQINLTGEEPLVNYFKLPVDYFEFSSVVGYGSKDKCLNKKFHLFEIKNQNKDEVINDEFNKPSFLYRESPYYISEDSVKVYVDDFKMDKIVLDYYRYPIQLRLLDEDNPESDFDTDFTLEFDQKLIDRIISEAVFLIQVNNKESEFQMNSQISKSKI